MSGLTRPTLPADALSCCYMPARVQSAMQAICLLQQRGQCFCQVTCPVMRQHHHWADQLCCAAWSGGVCSAYVAAAVGADAACVEAELPRLQVVTCDANLSPVVQVFLLHLQRTWYQQTASAWHRGHMHGLLLRSCSICKKPSQPCCSQDRWCVWGFGLHYE